VQKKEFAMPVRDMSARRPFFSSVAAAFLTIALSSGVAMSNAAAQSATNNGAKTLDPTKSFKVPPLPLGSAHVELRPGMSEKDWHDAYKETGRPKFQRHTVKHLGDNVERD